MVIMRNSILYLLFVFSLFLCSCEKEHIPIECEISYEITSETLTIGDRLHINGFKITPISPANNINIKKVEFYLGNRKIGTSNFPPYELDYEIPDIPSGDHLLQIDVYLTADGYDDTTYWLRQNIKIIKPQIIE